MSDADDSSVLVVLVTAADAVSQAVADITERVDGQQIPVAELPTLTDVTQIRKVRVLLQFYYHQLTNQLIKQSSNQTWTYLLINHWIKLKQLSYLILLGKSSMELEHVLSECNVCLKKNLHIWRKTKDK